MAKFKSLKENRWSRFRAFLRGMLLYNTVYWRRASDGVDRRASRVGRVEREKHRPRVDPEFLRPRVRPANEPLARAKPPADSPAGPMPRRVPSAAFSDGLFGNHLPDADDDAASEGIRPRRRRRVVRRRELHDKAVDPGRILRDRANPKSTGTMPGWLRWLLGWHH